MRSTDSQPRDNDSGSLTKARGLNLRPWRVVYDNILVAAFFAGFTGSIIMMRFVMINFRDFFLLALYVLIALLVIMRIVRSASASVIPDRLNILDIIRMALAAPLIVLLIIILNRFIILNTHSETYYIQSFKIDTANYGDAELIFKNDKLKMYPQLRKFSYEKENPAEWRYAIYQYENGIVGYKNISARVVVTKTFRPISF